MSKKKELESTTSSPNLLRNRNRKTRNSQDFKKFLLITALITILLVVLLYFLFMSNF